jgi:photosystem II stability/assembly factor-like uncharacterized protein
VILNTTDSGQTWKVQGNRAEWEGFTGLDISAVDDLTAWAALGDADSTDGMILHTVDGGLTWEIQSIPADVQDAIKGIKGLSRDEAWAVSLRGIILHTTNGGQTWDVVPHPDVEFIGFINRIDAVAPYDVWIVDQEGGDTGMVHSTDGGKTWRKEYFPDVDHGKSPLAISAVSPLVVWGAVNAQADLYRTLDGGDTWQIAAPNVSGPNDFDDVCAINADLVWAVLNLGGGSGGKIFRVRLEQGQVLSDQWNPDPYYQYEGITAFDAQTAWVVGFISRSFDHPELPSGIILHTNDGANWTSQKLPEDDVVLWKVSFVGAHR